jgi:hypothetical protein
MVFERHGVWASGSKDDGQWVEVAHVRPSGGDPGVMISHTSIKNPVMTVEQARYLASKLNRLARRIEGSS